MSTAVSSETRSTTHCAVLVVFWAVESLTQLLYPSTWWNAVSRWMQPSMVALSTDSVSLSEKEASVNLEKDGPQHSLDTLCRDSASLDSMRFSRTSMAMPLEKKMLSCGELLSTWSPLPLLSSLPTLLSAPWKPSRSVCKQSQVGQALSEREFPNSWQRRELQGKQFSKEK